jgi:hypothetical protein
MDTSPRVGLIVDVPHSADGMRSDPAVSVPVADGHLLRSERRGRAAARSTGRAVERPRVADLVRRPAAGELVCVQVPEEHHALRGEPRPDVAVALGTSSRTRLDAVKGLPATA